MLLIKRMLIRLGLFPLLPFFFGLGLGLPVLVMAVLATGWLVSSTFPISNPHRLRHTVVAPKQPRGSICPNVSRASRSSRPQPGWPCHNENNIHVFGAITS